MPKLLDEKVATLHLPVLVAALTTLTQLHTVSRGFKEGYSAVSSTSADSPSFVVHCTENGSFVQFASLTPFVSASKFGRRNVRENVQSWRLEVLTAKGGFVSG